MLRNSDIFPLLEKIRSESREVLLYNVYKALPVSYPARIESLAGRSAVFTVHRYQVVAMVLEGQTHIHCELLPDVIRARVDSTDIVAETAMLAEFSHTGEKIGVRNVIRVEPAERTAVEVFCRGQRIDGHLADLSDTGIGIYTLFPFARRFLEKDTPAVIRFVLPHIYPAIQISAESRYVRERPGGFRVGLRFAREPEVLASIKRYVTQRQIEILRELKVEHSISYRLQLKSSARS
jgi:hypothetical protein